MVVAAAAVPEKLHAVTLSILLLSLFDFVPAIMLLFVVVSVAANPYYSMVSTR